MAERREKWEERENLNEKEERECEVAKWRAKRKSEDFLDFNWRGKKKEKEKRFPIRFQERPV